MPALNASGPAPRLIVRYGLPGDAKSDDLVRRAEELGAGRALWLTRSQLRRRELERGWIERRGAGVRGLFATLADWSRERFERMPGRRPTIGDAEQARLIHRLLAEEGARGGSEHPFRHAERRFGLARRFQQLVATLKLSGCRRPKQVERLVFRMMSAGDGLANYLMEPVASVFGAYQRELERLGLVDEEEKLLAVEEALDGRWSPEGPEEESGDPDGPPPEPRPAWLGDAPELLVLEGWYQTTGVFRKIVRSMARRSGETVVLVDGVFPEGSEGEAGRAANGGGAPSVLHADAVHRRDLAFWRSLGARFERRDGRPFRSGFVAGLGALARRESWPAELPLSAPPMALSRFANPTEELRGIARRIVELRAAARAGTKPRVAVLFPTLERWAPLAEEVFVRYDVPFRVVDRVRLSATVPARLLRELLELVQRGFPRADAMAFLLSPLARFDEIGPREEIAGFDLLLRNARFHGGRGVERWRRALDRWRLRADRDEARLLDAIRDASTGRLADLLVDVEATSEDHDEVRGGAASPRRPEGPTVAQPRPGGLGPGAAPEQDAALPPLSPEAIAARDALAACLGSLLAGRDALAGEASNADDEAAAAWDAELIDDADPEERRGLRHAARDWLDLWRRIKLADGVGRRVVARLREWDALRSLKAPLDLAEAIIRLYRDLGVARALELRAERASDDWSASPLSERVIRRDLAAWRRAAKAVAEVGRLMALEGPTIPFDDFCRQVVEMLGAEELPPDPGSDPEETLLLSRLDARNLSFDVLFVAGMTAEAAPGQRKVNIFFTEKERRMVGWTTREDEIAEWRHLAAMLLAAAPRQEWSWHGAPDESPSQLLREACDAFGLDWTIAAKGNDGRAAVEPPLSARDLTLGWERAAKLPSLRVGPSGVEGFGGGAGSEIPAGDRQRFRRERSVRLLAQAPRVDARVHSARERDDPPDASRHDGLIDLAVPGLASMRRIAGTFSATACETYASCGWEAWARRLADLQPLPEFDAAPQALEQGRLVHRALAEGFLAARADLGTALIDPDPADTPRLARAFADSLAKSRAALGEAVVREGEEFPEADAFWLGRVERTGRGLNYGEEHPYGAIVRGAAERPFGPLDNLVHVHGEAMADFLPRFLEAGVGVTRGCLEVLTPEPVALSVALGAEGGAEERAPLLIRGIVDRVDLVQAGGKTYAVVFDYKTGEPPKPSEIAEGYRFQLPLYLKAVVESWGRERGVLPGGAFYLGLNAERLIFRGFAVPEVAAKLAQTRGKRPERAFEVKNADILQTGDMEAFLRACVANAAAARAAALRGRFATSWRPKSNCARCDYRRICRSDGEAKLAWWRERRHRLGELGYYAPVEALTTAAE
jgi:hypothetical protein